MKKTSIFLLAALALAGCAKNERLGGEAPAMLGDGSIGFSFLKPAATRADLVGSAAASKLNNHFVVYGTKHATAEVGAATNDKLVFNQYQVAYTPNTAGSTESNTHCWEYVGLGAYAPITGYQTIKYWDYAAEAGYTFYAFSSPNISYPKNASDLVSVDKTTAGTKVYDKGYTVTIKNGASLDDLYFSDRTPVAKTSYGKPVVLTFRNFGARVRVGFYETVPGYSVKIDNFYFDDDAASAVITFAAMDKTSTSFKAALQNVSTGATSNALTVTYYDDTDTDVENRPTIANTTVTYNYDLTLGTGITAATSLGTTSSAPTYDNGGAYTTVYPFEANNNPMLVRVDYTLTSTDGSGEVIKVKNARVVVPVQYVQWKSNFAYTYLFKISNNTNGTTGTQPTDPDDPSTGDKEGLYPITFDAVVVANQDAWQETITSVATNNVTTYAQGKIADEYKAGADVYAVVENTLTHDILAPSAIGAATGNAQVYKVTSTGDAISEASVLAKLTGAVNGLTLTAASASLVATGKVPANDGTEYNFGANGVVKFTPADAGMYAYVYCTTAYVAPTYAAVGSAAFDPAETYYFLTTGGVYYAASGLSAANFGTYKADLYTKTDDGTAGVYSVKVIKVQ